MDSAGGWPLRSPDAWRKDDGDGDAAASTGSAESDALLINSGRGAARPRRPQRWWSGFGAVGEASPAPEEAAAWWTVAAVGVCLFCIHCQPSEAFLTEYLRSDKGVSEAELDDFVWPVDTWVSLATLVPVGVAAEVVGYRVVAAFGLVCRQATRVLLIWGRGVRAMAAMQAVYAVGTNCDVILLTLLYTAVPPRRFKAVTSVAFAAQHAGSFVGSGLGQAMVDSDPSDLRRLFYVSWAFTTAGMVAFLALCGPPLRPPPPALATLLIRDGAGKAWGAVKRMYRGAAVRRWALWYFCAQSVYGVILNYYQNQVQDAAPHAKLGLFQMLLEATGVCGVAVASGLTSRLVRWPTAVVVATSAAAATMYLVATGASASIVAVCAGNVAAFAIALFAETVASYTVAEVAARFNVDDDDDDADDDTADSEVGGREGGEVLAPEGGLGTLGAAHNTPRDDAGDCSTSSGGSALGSGAAVGDNGADDDRRYAVIFTCNGTLALAWASALSAVGTAREWGTRQYYVAAIVELYITAAGALLLEALVRAWGGLASRGHRRAAASR